MTELTATEITDEETLLECKRELNKWSRKLPFTVSRQLGDDAEFVSAFMFHSYSFRVETSWAGRRFFLKSGGKPRSNPIDIKTLNPWQLPGLSENGEFDKAIDATCYAESCKECNGHGKFQCGNCNGTGEMTCPDCKGKGRVGCSDCRTGYTDGGEGTIPCKTCHGMGTVHNSDNTGEYTCPRCHGGKTETCTKCHGTGYVICSKCGGSRKVKCRSCHGTGELKCKKCEGRGWNPFVWHVVQKQAKDALKETYGDSGNPLKFKFERLSNYPSRRLFFDRVENDGLVSHEGIVQFSSDFMEELCKKYANDNAAHDESTTNEMKVHWQEVEFCQYDTLVKYTYKFNKKEYVIWIDLVAHEVFETDDQGLMKEWSQNISHEGDKFAFRNPQKAIYYYGMACAISKLNTVEAKKIRHQLALGSWLFRVATVAVGGWLWSDFFRVQGGSPYLGWYISAAIVALDFLFAGKWFLMSIAAMVVACGFVAYVFPEFVPSDFATLFQGIRQLWPIEIPGNVMMHEYIFCSVLIWLGCTLLFARDLALRIRGGVWMFPVLGGLVGAVCAPTAYLDFVQDPLYFMQIFSGITYIICGLAVARIPSRAFIQKRQLQNPWTRLSQSRQNGGIRPYSDAFETNAST